MVSELKCVKMKKITFGQFLGGWGGGGNEPVHLSLGSLSSILSGKTLKMISRAKTQLIMIIVDGENYQKHFQDAAAKGLVELVSI